MHQRILFSAAMAMLSVAWLLPDHNLPWTSWQNELSAFGAILILFLLIIVGGQSRQKLQIPVVIFIPAFMLFLVALQMVCGQIDIIGKFAMAIIYFGGIIAAILVGVNIADRHRFAIYFFGGILIAAVLSVFISLLQIFKLESIFPFMNSMPSFRRPGANLGQPNHIATLLLWANLSLIWLTNQEVISRNFAQLLAVILTGGIVMTESRTALVGAVCIAIWYGFWFPYHGSRRRLYLAAAAALATLSIGYFFYPAVITGITEGSWGADLRASSRTLESAARLMVWSQLLDAVMQHPWFGWGWGGVVHAINAVLDVYPSGLPFTYSHNIAIDFLIAFGVPVGMVLLVVNFSWFAWRAQRAANLLSWSILAMILIFGVHSFFEFPFAYAYFLLPVGLMIGLLEQEFTDADSKILIKRQYAAVLFVGLILVGGGVLRDYWLAEEDFRVARFEALRVGETPTSYVSPKIYILDDLKILNAATRVVPMKAMREEELLLLRKSVQLYPWPAIQNRYAMALALNGNMKEAKRQLKIIRAMHGELMYLAVQQQWKNWGQVQYLELENFAFP